MTRWLLVIALLSLFCLGGPFADAVAQRDDNNRSNAGKTDKSDDKPVSDKADKQLKQTQNSKAESSSGKTPPKTHSRSSRTQSFGKMTPARQAAAITFAQRHHPELAELLTNLKHANRSEYDKAIRELFRTSERLARLEETDPERHALFLNSWKLDSRIRLLAARMTMSNDSAIEAELKAALLERNQLKLQMMILDRSRMQSRLEKLNQSIGKLQQNQETAVARELDRLKKSLGAYTSQSKSDRNNGRSKQAGSPGSTRNKPASVKQKK